jgi:2-polyprenyl-6-methoxyphenol hydroxylase-like FAD-dependent oxidoreductase
MPHTIILGGGLCGLSAALMLARDGHRVTVLERDADPVPTDFPWERWPRTGVAQFRQAHYMHPRGRHVLDADLPDVRQALADAGAMRFDPLVMMPPAITDRERREGDERFVTWTARRSTIEHVVALAAEAQDGLEVRRGVRVAALEPRSGQAPVVRTDRGDRLAGDLVVDAMGRGSALPRLLGAVPERSDEGGFLYYTRYFRGTQPAIRGPLNAPHGTYSVLTLPADNGTWSVTVYGSTRDRSIKAARDAAHWTELVQRTGRHDHWLVGEPLTGVMAMGGVMSRTRAVAHGVDGLVSLGDAWACTNPALGRGMSFGLWHAALLRRAARAHAGRPAALTAAFASDSERELVPYHRATLATDRARLAEIDALLAGDPPPPPNPLVRAMLVDAEVFRGAVEILGCLALPREVFARPGFAARVEAAAGLAVAL